VTDVEKLIIDKIEVVRESNKDIERKIDKLTEVTVTKEMCNASRTSCPVSSTTKEDISLKKIVAVGSIITTLAATIATIVGKLT